MKRVLLCVCAWSAIGSATLPARAAGDAPGMRPAAAGENCAHVPAAQPLDHGPRATTTPEMNAHRRLEAHKRAEACHGPDKVSGAAGVGQQH